MLWCALVLTAGIIISLVVRYLRAEKTANFGLQGWVGLCVVAVSGVLLIADVRLVGLYFTPLAWTGYILIVDAAVFSLQRRSPIRSAPETFLWMAIVSLFLCLIFELYNNELLNRTYVGFPRGMLARYLGYGWLFMTVCPVVLETAGLLLALKGPKRKKPLPSSLPMKTTVPWTLLGVMLAIIPVLASWPIKVYLFAMVWFGFILLADTINYRASRSSILGDLLVGYRTRLWALLETGVIIGFLGEFWNYWARAKWLYIFPIFENYTFFEMPIIGYLGFPLLVATVFSMYILMTDLLNLPHYDIDVDFHSGNEKSLA